MKLLKYLSLSLVACGVALSSCDDFSIRNRTINYLLLLSGKQKMTSIVQLLHVMINGMRRKTALQIFSMPIAFLILDLIIVIQVL